MKWHRSSKKSNSEEQSEELRFLKIIFYKKHIIDAALQKSKQSYNYEAEKTDPEETTQSRKMQSPD